MWRAWLSTEGPINIEFNYINSVGYHLPVCTMEGDGGSNTSDAHLKTGSVQQSWNIRSSGRYVMSVVLASSRYSGDDLHLRGIRFLRLISAMVCFAK